MKPEQFKKVIENEKESDLRRIILEKKVREQMRQLKK